jgi:hypothetical protein
VLKGTARTARVYSSQYPLARISNIYHPVSGPQQHRAASACAHASYVHFQGCPDVSKLDQKGVGLDLVRASAVPPPA